VPAWLVFGFLTIVFWGIWGVLGASLGTMSPGEGQAFSTLGILPVMAAVACSPTFTTGGRPRRGACWAFAAGILVGTGNASYYAAVSLAPTATTVSFTSMYPLVTVILALCVLREQPRPWQWVGIALASIAIALLTVGWESAEVGAWLGYSFACVALWGLASLIMKVATRDVSAAQSTFWFLAAFVPLAGLILIWQPALIVPDKIHWNWHWTDWLAVSALGATYGLGNLSVLAAYRAGGKASVVTPLTGMYPVVTIPLAIGFFGERVGWLRGTGMLLALAAAAALAFEPESATALEDRAPEGNS
jgi:uncharacterized membrane protein